MKKFVSLLIVAVLFVGCMIPTAFANVVEVEEGATSATVTFSVGCGGLLNAAELSFSTAPSSFSASVSTVPAGNLVVYQTSDGSVGIDGFSVTATFALGSDAAGTEIPVTLSGTLASPVLGEDGKIVETKYVSYSQTVTIKVPAAETEPTVTEPTVTEPTVTEPSGTEPEGPKDDEPKTGDITPQIVFFGVAVMTLTAAVFFSMKRKAAK